jgi:hypothetical protein
MNLAQLDIASQLAPAYLTGKNVAQAVSAAAGQASKDLAAAGGATPSPPAGPAGGSHPPAAATAPCSRDRR